MPTPAAGRDGIDGANGKDGADAQVDHDALRALVLDEVTAAVLAMPRAKDGTNGKDGADAIVDVDAIVARVLALMPQPRDGRDGVDGRDAADLDPLPSIDEARSYRRGIWASHNRGLMRASRQTDPVKDGDFAAAGWVVMVEGVAGFVVKQGEDLRTIEVASILTSGTRTIASFTVPVIVYRFIWKDTDEYAEGDVVTYGGSMWYCMAPLTAPTKDRPGTGTSMWRLMVKEGRPGKDAPAPGEPVTSKHQVVRVK